MSSILIEYIPYSGKGDGYGQGISKGKGDGSSTGLSLGYKDANEKSDICIEYRKEYKVYNSYGSGDGNGNN